jgi:hypothetical protein
MLRQLDKPSARNALRRDFHATTLCCHECQVRHTTWTLINCLRKFRRNRGAKGHCLHAAANRLLTAIPPRIKVRMAAANTSDQLQYCAGWRNTRMKWRP